MLYRTETLLEILSEDYSNPACKLGRLVEEGKYIPIIRGLYETDHETPGQYLAEEIYGPSYLSFEYAMGVHRLISSFDDRRFTSATCMKHRTKHHETAFGTFEYRDVPAAVFGLEVNYVDCGDYSYSIANPEKALCDTLYTMPPVRNRTEMENLLFVKLGIDKYRLSELNGCIVSKLANSYRSTNVRALDSYINH